MLLVTTQHLDNSIVLTLDIVRRYWNNASIDQHYINKANREPKIHDLRVPSLSRRSNYQRIGTKLKMRIDRHLSTIKLTLVSAVN